MKLSNESKTGIFVLICIAALLGLLVKVANFSFFQKGYLLKTRFHFTGGVKANAPVRLSGVDVGTVRSIRLVNDVSETFAEVELRLDQGTKVRKDTKATVSTLGMMGEKYVELNVGASSDFALPGDTIGSTDPARLEELIEIGKSVAADIGTMAQDISRVADHVDDAIQDNRPKIDSIFENLEETSENFNDFSQDVKYHPWKVLAKGKEVPRDQMSKDRQLRRLERAKKLVTNAADAGGQAAVTAEKAALEAKKQNFGPAS
jgi:phospholipid/cholesterol/gamma-HCH transport system substrate-binding protein